MPCPLLGHIHGLQGMDMGLGGHLAVGGHSPCAEGRGKVLPRPPGGTGLGWAAGATLRRTRQQDERGGQPSLPTRLSSSPACSCLQVTCLRLSAGLRAGGRPA